MRFMTFVKSAETNGPPPQALMDAMGELIADSIKKGILVDTGGLAGTGDSARVRLEGGTITTTDGPFTEAKEVVGGYAILELPSMEAAKKEAKRFIELHRKTWPGWEGESEIRPLFTPPELG